MNRFCLCGLGLLMRHNSALALSAGKRFLGHKQARNCPSPNCGYAYEISFTANMYVVVCFTRVQTNMLEHK